MSKKSDQISKLLAKVEPRWPTPTSLEGGNLLEQGLHAVLQRRLDAKTSQRAIENLRKAYTDWNELRVSQSQEIAAALKLGQQGLAVAADVRAYLQEVFQRSHGLDLQFLTDDAEETKRFVSILPFIGMGTAHYLMLQAVPGEVPVTSALMRVLDRIGLVARTSNLKKARAAVAPLVGKDKLLEFALRMGEVATRWCDAKKPLCHECPIVDDCKYGRKAYREWRVQQERMEVQRVREEARLAILRKKEEAKAAREAERAAKKAAADAVKKAREDERKAKVEAKKKAAEMERLAEKKRKEDERKRVEDERKRKKAALDAERKAKAEADAKAKKEAAAKAKKAAEAAKKAAAAAKAKKAKAVKKPAKPAAKSGSKPAAKPKAGSKPASKPAAKGGTKKPKAKKGR